MELCKIYSTQVLEDAYLSSFRVSCRIDNSAWDLATTNPICFIRRWVFRKGASSQLLCLHLRLTLIIKNLTPGMECSLYVDDFLICYRSRYMHIIERHLQRTLNKLQARVDTNGFKFSESKTVFVHFSKHRTVNPFEWNSNCSSWTSQILGLDFWQSFIFYPALALSQAEVFKSPQLAKSGIEH